MLCVRVQIHMPTQLIMHTAALVVKAAVVAALHVRQTVWRGEPEDAALLFAVSRRHHDCNCLFQHGLVATLCVDVNTAQEACLQDTHGRRQTQADCCELSHGSAMARGSLVTACSGTSSLQLTHRQQTHRLLSATWAGTPDGLRARL